MTRAPRAVLSAFARRPNLAAALVYLVVALIFLGPSLLPGKTLSNSDLDLFKPPWAAGKPAALTAPSNPELGDAPEQLQLFVHRAADQFPHVQLWDPNIAGGRPFEANSQSAIFSIFSIPAYLLPFLTALGWIGVMKLWAAGFGAFLLGRSLGMRWSGALLAGLVYALNFKMVTWISYPHESVWALIPWLLVLTDRLVRRPDLLAGVGLAFVVGLQFLCGHAESSFHAMMTTVLFFALRLWQARRAGPPERAGPGRTTVAFGCALAGGAALAAIALVPFFELLLHSADYHARRGQSIDVSLALRESIGVFLPDFWGRSTQSPIRIFMLERALYVGALPLMLAFAAVILRPKLERVWIAVFGAVWFCVVLGIPPILQIVTRLPVFSSGHNTRLIILTMLAVSLLAGFGLDDIRERIGSAKRERSVLLVASVLFVIPIVVVAAHRQVGVHDIWPGLKIAWGFVRPPGEFNDPAPVGLIRAYALWIWVGVAGAALALLLARRRGWLGPRLFTGLALLLVAVDLFRAGMGFNPAIDQKIAKLPETPAIRYLQHQGLGRVAAQEYVPQNILGFTFGLYESRGYDLPILRRYNRFWRTNVEPEAPSSANGLFVALSFYNAKPKALRALRLLGTTHILWPTSTLSTDPPLNRLVPYPPLKLNGTTQVYAGRDARVYRVDGALPRTWIVGTQRPVDGGSAAYDAVERSSFRPRSEAITEKTVAGVPRAAPAGAPGQARIVHYGAQRVRIRTTSTRAGMLILGDNYYPGWKASLDGHDVPVERADYLFRGVALPAGRHTVTFRYQPASWRVGWIVSLVALVGLALLLGLALVRRRAR